MHIKNLETADHRLFIQQSHQPLIWPCLYLGSTDCWILDSTTSSTNKKISIWKIWKQQTTDIISNNLNNQFKISYIKNLEATDHRLYIQHPTKPILNFVDTKSGSSGPDATPINCNAKQPMQKLVLASSYNTVFHIYYI